MKAGSIGFNWKLAIFLITVLFVLALGGYQQTVLYLTGVWSDIAVGEYAHGFLVLAIAVYLVIINRHRLQDMSPCPDVRILPLMVLAVGFWVIAALVDVQVAQAFAFWLISFTLLWVMLGTKVMLVLAFPIAYILFALPIWFPLSPLLQDITADAVYYIIRQIGVPALRQENVIVLSSGSLSIEEACSGLRYLMAALTLSTLYAYLNYQGFMARVMIIAVSAAAAVLSNFVRVFIVVYLGYTTEMKHPLVYDHLMLGWYLFGGVVIVLLFIDNQVARRFSLAGGPDLSSSAHTSAPVLCRKTIGTTVFVSLSCAGLLMSGPLLVGFVENQANSVIESNKTAEIALPVLIGGWHKNDEIIEDWQPVFNGAKEAKRVYVKDGKQVTLYVGYYTAQGQGQELINDLNKITNKKVWRTKYAHDRLVGDQQKYREQLLVKSGDAKRLVWYQYNVAGKNTVNIYEAKILQALGVLTGKSQAYVMAVASSETVNVALSRKTLAEFYADVEMFIRSDEALIFGLD